MPILINKSLTQNTQLMVWNIAEDINWLKINVTLTKEEENLYNTFTHDHRRKQWLAVRLLLQQYFAGRVNHSIQYNEFGKPHFKELKLNISVSHSHDLAGIIVSPDAVPGLDIEHLEHRIEKLKDKFLSVDELQMVKDSTANEQLHIMWCAKEVMYKIYGKKRIEFKEDMKIMPFDYKAKGEIQGALIKESEDIKFNIHYEKLEGYVIVWSA